MTAKEMVWAVTGFWVIQGLAIFLNFASGNDWGTPEFGLVHGLGMLIWVLFYGFWRNDRSSDTY